MKIPLYQRLLKLADEIPDEEFDKLPVDASLNLDYYLYGSKKKEQSNLALTGEKGKI